MTAQGPNTFYRHVLLGWDFKIFGANFEKKKKADLRLLKEKKKKRWGALATLSPGFQQSTGVPLASVGAAPFFLFPSGPDIYVCMWQLDKSSNFQHKIPAGVFKIPCCGTYLIYSLPLQGIPGIDTLTLSR